MTTRYPGISFIVDVITPCVSVKLRGSSSNEGPGVVGSLPFESLVFALDIVSEGEALGWWVGVALFMAVVEECSASF